MTIEILEPKMNKSLIPILGRNYYQGRIFRIVPRELLQNSIDAIATKIDITFENNTLTVTDNGIGIPYVKDLLDTIGGTLKPEDFETIGGFGMAKVAIFACKFWKFQSISGSYKTGYIYDSEDKTESGTIVTVEFDTKDIHWGDEQYLKTYLQGINRNDLTISYNESIVSQPILSQVQIGSRIENISKIGMAGYISVRVNGLPTFDNYVDNLKENIVIDYQIDIKPENPDYPLTANRDGFREDTKEFEDLKNRTSAINQKCDMDKRLSENIHKTEKEMKFRNVAYISKGNVTLEDYKNNAMLISTWQRYIIQIAEIMGYSPSDLKFGLSDGSHENACYRDNTFNVRIGITNKGEILGLAEHEFVHHMGYGMTGHDQSYASHLTSLVGHVNNSIFNGEFRK